MTYSNPVALLEENRKLRELNGKYARNLRNNSSQEILDSLVRQIQQSESRIARLYSHIFRTH